jgi:hypothetical protein
MTRYIKQRDHFSCLPVAILNMRKWLGDRVSYRRNYRKARTECGATPGIGSDRSTFAEVTRFANRTRMFSPTVQKIDEALAAGNAVVLRSSWGKAFGWSHIFLVTKRTERSFFCVNTFAGHRWFRKTVFEGHYLQKHPDAPVAWVIRRDNDAVQVAGPASLPLRQQARPRQRVRRQHAQRQKAA